MMKAYLVFGDPRRVHDARTFTSSVDSSDITVREGHASVIVGGREFYGVILAHQSSDLGPNNPPYVSMLLSEFFPDEETNSLLLSCGWEVTQKAPRAVTVPFSVEAFLLVTSDTEPAALYTTKLWLDRSLVPTQRIAANPPSGVSFPAQVLAMDSPGPGTRPIAAFTVSDETLTFDSNGDIVGWVAAPILPIPPQWEEMARVCEAIEAQVQYLLASPVVVGVNLHDLDKITSADISDLLPADVAEEVVEALEAAGRSDLIPE